MIIIVDKYFAVLKQILLLHTNPKVDHRTEEVNISTSNGHNFFKSGHGGKTILDSPYPIVK